MGVILCDLHGRQQITFTSVNLYNYIDNNERVEFIYKVEIEYVDDIIDVFFIDVLNEEELDEKSLVINLQKEGELAKPICNLCFRKYVESNSVKIIVKRFLSTFI